jgi:hypothetical protein
MARHSARNDEKGGIATIFLSETFFISHRLAVIDMQKREFSRNGIKVSQYGGYDNCLDVILRLISDEYLSI